MKRSFNSIQELQRRFPQRFIPARTSLFPQGISLSMLATFGVTFALAMMLFVLPGEASASPFADMTAAITTLKTDLIAALGDATKAMIAIGAAAIAIFVAANILRWFRSAA